MLISVIIPTYNKKSFLLKTLHYLDKQTLSKESYEVILIDDGSNDATEDYIKNYTINSNVRYFKKMHGGPGSARNLGIKHARGGIIVFTDDDCIIPPDWLKNIYDFFIDNDEIAGMEGKTISLISRMHPLTHQVINMQPQGVFPTCNMAYRKQTLEKIGGFYYKFKYPHDEDVDLAWNVLKFGDILFNTSALIIHPVYNKNIYEKLRWIYYFKDEIILYNRHKALYKKFRGKNPWILIWYHIYIKYNYFFLLRNYLRHEKGKIFVALTLQIFIFLILQGALFFFISLFFIYNYNEK